MAPCMGLALRFSHSCSRASLSLFLIKATAYLMLVFVLGLSRALQQFSNSCCPSIFVAMHDSHAWSLAKYIFFIALGEADVPQSHWQLILD